MQNRIPKNLRNFLPMTDGIASKGILGSSRLIELKRAVRVCVVVRVPRVVHDWRHCACSCEDLSLDRRLELREHRVGGATYVGVESTVPLRWLRRARREHLRLVQLEKDMEYMVHGSKNQNDTFINLLWSEFAETNERRSICFYALYAWSRSVEADRNVAHSFRQARSKVSLKLVSKKVCFYIAQYLVRCTAQSTLHFTHCQTCSFTTSPTRLLWEAF